MKKSLLLFSALVSGLTMSAQNGKQLPANRLEGVKVMRAQQNTFADVDAAPATGLKPLVGNNAKVNAPPYPFFSNARNAFGFIVSESNCLTYNADLNTVAFTQRFTQDWPNSAFPTAPGAGASGYLVTKWSSNNGANWDSTCYFRDDVNWLRYPSSVILNPVGNTTVTNARIVGFGPTTVAAGGWYGNAFASAPMDGSLSTVAGMHTQTTNDQQLFLANSSAIGRNTTFARWSAVENNGTVWVGADKNKNAGAATPSGAYGSAFFKGTLSGSAMTWTQDSSFTHKWTTSGTDEDVASPRIAFGPDKLTGYILINGSDSATACAPCDGYKPTLWKTTDGGSTWNRVNQGFNWSSLPIWGNLPSTRNGNGVLPGFFDTYGGEIAVDMNGMLHYVTAVSPHYSDQRDSLGFGFVYPFSYRGGCDNNPWIFDFTTTGNGQWSANFLGMLLTTKMGSAAATDTTAGYNIWANGSASFAYDNRIQITRANDGSKIFYSWTDTDTSGGNRFNNSPSLMYMGYDVASNLYTAKKSIDYSNTNTGIWFHYVADIAMNPGAGNWRLPAVYSESRGQTYNSMTTMDLYYIDDVDLNDAEFVLPGNGAVVPCMVGVKENNSVISSVSQNFPNPFSSSTSVNVALNNQEDITFVVYNTMGQTILSKTIKGNAGENKIDLDCSGMNAGIYYYTVKAGGHSVSKKMILQK